MTLVGAPGLPQSRTPGHPGSPADGRQAWCVAILKLVTLQGRQRQVYPATTRHTRASGAPSLAHGPLSARDRRRSQAARYRSRAQAMPVSALHHNCRAHPYGRGFLPPRRPVPSDRGVRSRALSARRLARLPPRHVGKSLAASTTLCRGRRGAAGDGAGLAPAGAAAGRAGGGRRGTRLRVCHWLRRGSYRVTWGGPWGQVTATLGVGRT